MASKTPTTKSEVQAPPTAGPLSLQSSRATLKTARPATPRREPHGFPLRTPAGPSFACVGRAAHGVVTRRRPFEKPAISIPEQVVLLRRRGLLVDDLARAERCLGLISYYRLRPYWLPFEIWPQRGGDHAFREDATFEDVLTLYRFDQQLRRLVLDGIEPVEVALRARWAHHMAVTHGPHGYLNEDLYHDATRYRTAVDMLTRQFQRSQDTFAEHYRETYDSPLPPAWMAAEVMSFGQLLTWMVNLERRRDKQAIVPTMDASGTSGLRTPSDVQGSLSNWLKRFRGLSNGASITRWPSSTTSWGPSRRKHHGGNGLFN